jgi:hypothetical protein
MGDLGGMEAPRKRINLSKRMDKLMNEGEDFLPFQFALEIG